MKRVFPPLLAGVLLAGLFAATAVAAKSPDADKQIEASMVVTGSIEVEPDGSVSGYTLDQPDKLPQGVVDLAAKAVPAWRFEPVLVDGRPVAAKAKMSLRVFARKLGPERYEVGIRSANFGDEGAPGESVNPRLLEPPKFPPEMAFRGISATAYVVVRIGRDGHVEDVIAEQVNLKISGSPKQAAWRRDVFAKAALATARKWTFNPPTKGEASGKDHWEVRVPVQFLMQGDEVAYGQWDAYFPGPRQTIPWEEPELSAAFTPDAVGDSGVYSMRQSLHLLTPLGEG